MSNRNDEIAAILQVGLLRHFGASVPGLTLESFPVTSGFMKSESWILRTPFFDKDISIPIPKDGFTDEEARVSLVAFTALRVEALRRDEIDPFHMTRSNLKAQRFGALYGSAPHQQLESDANSATWRKLVGLPSPSEVRQVTDMQRASQYIKSYGIVTADDVPFMQADYAALEQSVAKHLREEYESLQPQTAQQAEDAV